MSTQTIKGVEARQRLLDGINEVADAARSTLGPGGRNVFIQKINGPSHLTKDGVTVSESIYPLGMVEYMGAEVIKQAASQAGKLAGDGTTSCTILCQAIATAAIEEVNKGRNPTEMKIGMEKAVKDIVAKIKEVSVPIGDDYEKIRHIATISGNNNPEIGDMVYDAVQKVTVDGFIGISDSRGYETKTEVINGFAFEQGQFGNKLAIYKEKFFGDVEDPYVFVSDYIMNGETNNNIYPIMMLAKSESIRRYHERFPEAKQLTQEEVVRLKAVPMIIIVSEIDEANMRMIVTARDAGEPLFLVRAPGWGDLQKELLKDIASVVDAKVVWEDSGRTMSNVKLEEMGRCDSVSISSRGVIMKGGAGDTVERVAELKSHFDIVAESNHNFLRERIGRMSGGVAMIHVGAKTEVEAKEKKDRVDDAVRAVRAAIEEGVVTGGGLTFLNIGKSLGVPLGESPSDESAGYDIVIESLMTPIKQIISNCGITWDSIFERIIEVRNTYQDSPTAFQIGYNAKTGEVADLYSEGILDPAKVLRVAIENAVSVASTIMTTENVIIQL